MKTIIITMTIMLSRFKAEQMRNLPQHGPWWWQKNTFKEI